jgi:hypothetical protein
MVHSFKEGLYARKMHHLFASLLVVLQLSHVITQLVISCVFEIDFFIGRESPEKLFMSFSKSFAWWSFDFRSHG